MEHRQKKQKEDTTITQPLDELKVELRGFNKKTSQYFEEKRYLHSCCDSAVKCEVCDVVLTGAQGTYNTVC
jgi:hypothetical protein